MFVDFICPSCKEDRDVDATGNGTIYYSCPCGNNIRVDVQLDAYVVGVKVVT